MIMTCSTALGSTASDPQFRAPVSNSERCVPKPVQLVVNPQVRAAQKLFADVVEKGYLPANAAPATGYSTMPLTSPAGWPVAAETTAFPTASRPASAYVPSMHLNAMRRPSRLQTATHTLILRRRAADSAPSTMDSDSTSVSAACRKPFSLIGYFPFLSEKSSASDPRDSDRRSLRGHLHRQSPNVDPETIRRELLLEKYTFRGMLAPNWRTSVGTADNPVAPAFVRFWTKADKHRRPFVRYKTAALAFCRSPSAGHRARLPPEYCDLPRE
jgi:hypothetical protein